MSDDNIEIASLAGGCFWCLEAVFQELKGVTKVVSGYTGGQVKDPIYESVSTGTTGHAETVQLTFDPNIISYRELLEIFFTIHNPTTPNRQGADIGSQYRSAIFFNSKKQEIEAMEVIEAFNAKGIWNDPIITEVKPAEEFFVAESYHQNYFKNHPDASYCQIVIEPKVAKTRKLFLDKLK